MKKSLHKQTKYTKDFFQKQYQQLHIPVPETHFVLGSLFEKAFSQVRNEFSDWELRGKIPFSEVPGLPSTTAYSHSGEYYYFLHKALQKSICFQSGRLHGYEGLSPQDVAHTVIGPNSSGTTRFVLSNISGSLTFKYPIGSVVAITDHINLTHQSPLCGRSRNNTSNPKTSHSSPFTDMTNAYHPQMTKDMIQILKNQNLEVNKGIYVGLLGPQLETPAEVRMLRQLGADIVGMSTIWEVIALRYRKAEVSAFSVVSNMACGVGTSIEIHYDSLSETLKKIIQSFFQFVDIQT